MNKMTPSEVKLMNLIKVYKEEYKRYPSVYEMADIMDVQDGTVRKIISSLVKKGLMTKPDKNGNIELLMKYRDIGA